MKRQITLFGTLFLAMAVAYAAPVPIAPGVTYERLQRPGPAVAHVVRATLAEASLTSLVSPGGTTMTQTATLPEIIAAESTLPGAPAAALNGGYSLPSAEHGAAVGLLVADGELLCDAWPVPRSALVLPAQGTPRIDRLGLVGTIAGPAGAALPLAGLNRPRGADELVLYTTRYAQTSRARGAGRQVILRDAFPAGIKLLPGAEYTGTVAAAVDGMINVEIPANGAIVAGAGRAATFLAGLQVGDRVTFRYELQPDPGPARAILGGGPRLLRDGRISVEAAAEQLQVRADLGRQPRSAVGVSATHLFLVAVDGRQPGYSEGLDLTELAALLRDLGATDAMELDGGGATTMVLGDELVNRPSDGAARALASALVLRSTGPVDLAGLSTVPAAGDPATVIAQVPPVTPVTPEPAVPEPTVPTPQPPVPQPEPVVPEPVTPTPTTPVAAPVRLGIEPAEIVATVGETVPLRVVGLDVGGAVVPVDLADLSWELTPAGPNALGSVTTAGNFVARRAGNGRLTVRHGERSTTIGVRVAEADGTVPTTPDPATPVTTEPAEGTEPAAPTAPPAVRPGADYQRPPITVPDGTRRNIDGFEQAGHWAVRTQPELPTEIAFVAQPRRQGQTSAKVSYDFSGTDQNRALYLDFQDNDGKKVNIGAAKAVSVWVYGDGNGHRLRGHFVDRAGKRFVIEFTQHINWAHSWARCTAVIPADATGELTWDGFILSQDDPQARTAGYIFFDELQGIY